MVLTNYDIRHIVHAKDFYCEKCTVEFRIVIEPRTTIPQERFKEEYPESIKWLDKVIDCPVCGATLEEA